MFDRLARGIIKHHKAIIVLWIILLLVSIPGLQFVSEVLVYEEMGFAPEDVESQEAQDVIDDQFPTSLANSTIMVVVESSDIASEAVRDFAVGVEHEIWGDSGISYLENVTSVYSIFNFTFSELAQQMAPAMAYTYANLTVSRFRMFSGPEFYSQEWGETPVNDTIFQNSFSNYSTWHSSNLTNYALGGEPLSYAQWFRWGWNWTFNPAAGENYTGPGNSSVIRGQKAFNMTAPFFFNFTQPGNDTYKQLMGAIYSTLNITTWDSSAVVYPFFLGMMAQYSGITNANLLDDIYNLGASPTEEDIYQFSQNQLQSGTVDSYPVVLPAGSLEFLMSRSTNTMLIVIDFSITALYREDGRKPMEDNIELVRQAVTKTKSGLDSQFITTYVTGDVALGADIEEAAFKDVERIDPVTIGLVFLIIGLFFVSFVTPGIAVGSIGIAVLISQSIIVIVGALIAKVHFSVLTLMLTAMLGAGTDYAIFLMARYREERLRGNSKEKSVEECVKWAGESITTSGLAVMISFGALSLGSLALIRTMGLTIMLGIGMALLVALTFIPSLLMTLGDRIFWPGNKKWKNPKKKGGAYARYFRKSARLSVKYAKPITIAAILISLPAAYAVFSLDTSFDFLAAMPETEASEGLEAMGRGFGEGRITPTYVVVDLPVPVRTAQDGTGYYDLSIMGSIENLSYEIEQIDAIQQVVGPTRPQGEPVNYSEFNDAAVQEQLGPSINQTIGQNDRSVLLTVIPKKEAFSKEAVSSMPVLRSVANEHVETDSNLDGATILVGGASATVWDIKEVLDGDFILMAIVVIVADYVLLMFVLGSVLVPLRLILTILLSVSWTIAMTLLIFQVWLQIPVLWLVPWILFVIAMGLGMDYDIFLTTRIREEVAKGKSDKEAIVTAVEKTGGIITAAGLVMAGAFATMMLSSLGLLQEFGFALAFVILLDAMIVRIYLVPSVMILLEKWNWWAPGRLQRVRKEEKRKRKKNR